MKHCADQRKAREELNSHQDSAICACECVWMSAATHTQESSPR
jgi:hypothetical protein